MFATAQLGPGCSRSQAGEQRDAAGVTAWDTSASRECCSPWAEPPGCGYQSFVPASDPSVGKASWNEGYKSHLDKFSWAFLSCSFLLILRLAKKQNFHRWEMVIFCVWLFCGAEARGRKCWIFAQMSYSKIPISYYIETSYFISQKPDGKCWASVEHADHFLPQLLNLVPPYQTSAHHQPVVFSGPFPQGVL